MDRVRIGIGIGDGKGSFQRNMRVESVEVQYRDASRTEQI